MSQQEYYISKEIENNDFQGAIDKVTSELKNEGFGIVSEIDFQNTFKEKIGVNISRYVVLGACNPPFAYRSVMSEARIGLMLPCNVLIRDVEGDNIEVSIVDPLASMQSVDNQELIDVAEEIQTKLKRVVAKL